MAATEIIDRSNEISFNSSLIREVRTIKFNTDVSQPSTADSPSTSEPAAQAIAAVMLGVGRGRRGLAR
jgi:hypothetical protein